jgi:hypothetical protein
MDAGGSGSSAGCVHPGLLPATWLFTGACANQFLSKMPRALADGPRLDFNTLLRPSCPVVCPCFNKHTSRSVQIFSRVLKNKYWPSASMALSGRPTGSGSQRPYPAKWHRPINPHGFKRTLDIKIDGVGYDRATGFGQSIALRQVQG